MHATAALEGRLGATVKSCRLSVAFAGKHAAMDYGQDVAVLGEVDGLPAGQTLSDGQHVLKFEIQLYKVRDNEYVVDFQVRLCNQHCSVLLHDNARLCCSCPGHDRLFTGALRNGSPGWCCCNMEKRFQRELRTLWCLRRGCRGSCSCS